MISHATQVRARPEGGGVFAPALGGGSGANRIESDPETPRARDAMRLQRYSGELRLNQTGRKSPNPSKQRVNKIMKPFHINVLKPCSRVSTPCGGLR